MKLLMVAGIVTILVVLVAVAKRQIKRRSSNPASKPLGATRISPAVAAKVLPPEVKPMAAEPLILTVQPPKTLPPKVFHKEQALLAASQGRLARSQLLQILDSAKRMGLSAEEESVFEAAIYTASPSPAKALPERVSNPKPTSNKWAQLNHPQDERVPYATYVPHNSPPVIVPARKRKSSGLPLIKGPVGGTVYGEYHAAGESPSMGPNTSRRTQKPMPLPVKPHVRHEGKSGNSFAWPIQKVSVPVISSANASTEPLSDAADTTTACRSCGECFPSNHELRAHRCVLMSAEKHVPELPCGGCRSCYACRYLRITRGE